MVFHITNYMRETNVWMIRKMRWVRLAYSLDLLVNSPRDSCLANHLLGLPWPKGGLGPSLIPQRE